jgi:hypothetical protein
MSEKTPIERLTELAEGWDCAAKAEQAVMAGFQEWKEQFDADERSAQILRYTRVWCEARDNRDRFNKDAAAIRWALASIEAPPQAGTTARQTEPREEALPTPNERKREEEG